MSGERELWLWLAASGITPLQFASLMNEYGSVEGIGRAFHGYSVRQDASPISLAAMRRLREAAAPSAMNELESAMKRNEMQLVTREDEGFPPLLRYLDEHAPIALFVRGQTDLRCPRTFAIVGTRTCTRYGEQATAHIAAQLAAEGVTVVSGMARGIDTAAHMGCLSAHGRTIAVLGCGADIAYPAENRQLIQRVLDSGGSIVSEYAPGVPPISRNFPVRNRIVSGMCSGVLLIEASARSGAMITVRLALEQGREVYALPGPVTSPTSEMPLALVREGCQIAANATDILRTIRWLGESEELAPSPPVRTAPKPDAPSAKRPVRQPESAAALGAGPDWSALSAPQRKVAEALSTGGLAFSEILVRTGLPAAELNSHLTMLELQGIIVQFPGRIYALDK